MNQVSPPELILLHLRQIIGVWPRFYITFLSGSALSDSCCARSFWWLR